MSNIKTCVFCLNDFDASGNSRSKACKEHQPLTKIYIEYKHNCIRRDLYCMTRDRWYQFQSGQMDLLSKCEACKEFYELTDEEFRSGKKNIRRFCHECYDEIHGLRHEDRMALEKEIFERVAKKDKSDSDELIYKKPVDYSEFPENWGMAEFMATLPKNGKRARDFIKERGYAIDIMPGEYRQGYSTNFSHASVSSPQGVGRISLLSRV